ncbi:hypothetical protein Agub_g7922 [Astrephomene gubernaculifera]|uniref:Helicase-associated domain-containing protein n=1 Tax=Astrephomene gubernaculifera TaxID=47775 RepID=A0AAD3DQT5_9CHLO|nr:hypothetical protein Agub_g7922 [Astrephomene gubernaculifera]
MRLTWQTHGTRWKPQKALTWRLKPHREFVARAVARDPVVQLLDSFWKARGVLDPARRKLLVDAADALSEEGALRPLDSAPLPADAPLPGLTAAWQLEQSAPEVRRVSRRLVALQQLLGGCGGNTGAVAGGSSASSSSSWTRHGSSSSRSSSDAGRGDVDLVWMVVREPRLLTADMTEITRRLLDMKVATYGTSVDVLAVVEAQPSLFFSDRWQLDLESLQAAPDSRMDSPPSSSFSSSGFRVPETTSTTASTAAAAAAAPAARSDAVTFPEVASCTASNSNPPDMHARLSTADGEGLWRPGLECYNRGAEAAAAAVVGAVAEAMAGGGIPASTGAADMTADAKGDEAAAPTAPYGSGGGGSTAAFGSGAKGSNSNGVRVGTRTAGRQHGHVVPADGEPEAAAVATQQQEQSSSASGVHAVQAEAAVQAPAGTAVQRLVQAWQYGVASDSDEEWALRLAQLSSYVGEHGDACVGFRQGDDPQLGRWAAKQRADWRRGQLGERRLSQLSALGFLFDSEEAEWVRWWRELAAAAGRQQWQGKDEDGRQGEEQQGPQQRREELEQRHVDLLSTAGGAATQPDMLYLVNWCSVQRIARRSGVLPESRIRRLDELGFDWSGADPLS